MSAPPPARYRVVEQDRRLVVIDRWDADGRPGPTLPLAPGAVPALLGGIRRTRFDGSAELATHPLYDGNGPRLIRLDPNSAVLIRVARYAVLVVGAAIVVAVAVAPWLLIPAGFAAFKSHRRVRTAATRWLDTVAREAG